MNEIVYITEPLKENFRILGCGLVDYVEIYRTEGDKVYFKAGNGKFNMTRSELEEYTQS